MAPTVPRRARPLILHVDDMKEILSSTRAMLESLSMDSLVAETAAEGLKLAKEKKPDLILMDIGMPEIDGHKATRILRADPDTRAIPILMVTGSDDKADVEKAIAAGANGYIIKPIHIDRLKSKIGEWVQFTS